MTILSIEFDYVSDMYDIYAYLFLKAVKRQAKTEGNCMTVNPGFAGQRYLSYVTPKVKRFVEAKETFGYQLIIDGACSPEVISRAASLGVDGAVLGTSALFGKVDGYATILSRLHAFVTGD